MATETLKYPEASVADEDEILAMAEFFHLEDGHPLAKTSRDAIRRLLIGSEFGRIHFIEASGVRIGYFALCFTLSIEFGGEVVILDDLFIKQEFRSRGVGTRVLAQVEDFALELGGIQIFLEVEKENERAFTLYKKNGFELRDRRMMARSLFPPPLLDPDAEVD